MTSGFLNHYQLHTTERGPGHIGNPRSGLYTTLREIIFTIFDWSVNNRYGGSAISVGSADPMQGV